MRQGQTHTAWTRLRASSPWTAARLATTKPSGSSRRMTAPGGERRARSSVCGAVASAAWPCCLPPRSRLHALLDPSPPLLQAVARGVNAAFAFAFWLAEWSEAPSRARSPPLSMAPSRRPRPGSEVDKSSQSPSRSGQHSTRHTHRWARDLPGAPWTCALVIIIDT